jgi:hypothetical protein
MQRVATRRNSKVQELSDKLAVETARLTLLLRGIRVHRFRELEVVSMSTAKGYSRTG